MEEAPSDPLDISKEVDVIKDAQKDLSKVDVLVCGGCHEVFHYVEEFQNHKSDKCTDISILKCENEEKTQIWGFTLWKCKQIRTHKSNGEEPPSSWEIYQKWTKLTQDEKDMWITAGRTLQFISKIATGKIKDEKKEDKDPLAIDDDFTNEVSNPVKSGILKNVTVIQGSKRALRTAKDNEKKEEYNVEKILGKRFNPRKRYWEYEVKWESYAEATWEPLIHLENCKALVQEFESKLKAEKEKDKTPGRGRGRPRVNPNSPAAVKVVQKKPATPPTSQILVSTTPGGGRPQRTSKQKALNQVKAWCGNMSDEEGGGAKRPYDDEGESDDSFEKKMKFDESEDTEEDEPKPAIRKVAKIVHTYNNGAAGKTQTPTKLPDNVLIPDAKGVVRISQKQLPSLSSGVYIMSKSSGIIKLDPAASKIATSGGQAIVKVSPKIGQTQIKIIKREDGSKRVVQVKGPEQIMTPTLIATKPKVVQQPANNTPVIKRDVVKVQRKVETPKPQTPKAAEKKEEPKAAPAKEEEDSDDGIPDWEFPTDLPVPEPDSPPREFVLDPFTGKVAGLEYPEPEPEPEPVIEQEKKEEETPSQTLENIVKLAAAEITEDDLKPDEVTEPPTTTTAADTTTTTPLTITTTTVTSAPSTTPTITKTTPTPTATVTATNEIKTSQSILTTAIANSNILQKTLQSPPTPRAKTQPRIINQAVAKPRTSMTPLVRNVRPPPKQPPKPKFNIAPMRQKDVTPTPKTNSMVKKINNANTNVYKAKSTQSSLIRKPAPKPAPVVPAAPKPVISMPSLDEEPPVVLAAPPKVTDTPTVETDLSTFTLATGDRPMFITGDDGTVYQVAGQNEEGQTILLTQDSDGQQQCLLVTSDALQEEVEQVGNPAEVLMEVQEPVEVAEEQPLIAQFIRTEPPSPGGTHKVVVMLPDGDMMVTQVSPEEYADLELDK